MSIFDRLRKGLSTQSASATKEIAMEFAELIPDDSVIALHGTLGVGKTTFVQGLALGFGITEHVTSPTFTIYNIHRGEKRVLVHLDAYRLEQPDQMEALMVDDFLLSPWCLAIEWPEKLGNWLPSNAMHLTLGIDHADRHWIRLE